MPYSKRKSYKRRYARTRRYKRTNRRYKRNTNRLSSYRPLRRSQIYKTRYADQGVVLNPGLGGIPSTYVFSANGLYDPDVTGIGHQPIGFDQLVGVMYDHYVVVGAKITATFTNLDSSNGQVVGIMLKDNPTPESDARVMIENGNVKYKTISHAGSGGSQVTVSAKINPNKFLGHSKPLSDDAVKGDASHNPSEQAYFHVFSFPQQNVDAGSVECFIRIDYTAMLIEPKKLELS